MGLSKRFDSRYLYENATKKWRRYSGRRSGNNNNVHNSSFRGQPGRNLRPHKQEGNHRATASAIVGHGYCSGEENGKLMCYNGGALQLPTTNTFLEATSTTGIMLRTKEGEQQQLMRTIDSV